jgi:hypothetical protein
MIERPYGSVFDVVDSELLRSARGGREAQCDAWRLPDECGLGSSRATGSSLAVLPHRHCHCRVLPKPPEAYPTIA